MTRVLTADIATTTGIGVANPGEMLRLFHFTIQSKDAKGNLLPNGVFFMAFRQQFAALLDRERPEVVAHEAPVLIAFKREKGFMVKDNMAKVRKLCGMVAIVQELCAERGIICREYQPSEIKKALTGHANAVKEHMVRAARVMGFDPQTDDEADALGLMVLATERYLPKVHAALLERQKRTGWFENISNLKQQASRKRAANKAKAKPKSETHGTLL